MSESDPLPDEAASDASEATDDLRPVIAENLKRLRVKRGLSLERLAKLSGVSKAMLGQIELGQSTPTVKTVWKTAVALGVPFAALIETRDAHVRAVLRQTEAKELTSHDGAFRSRALFPVGQPRSVEFYRLRFAAGAEERADAHAPGTRENLVVHAGKLEITAGPMREVLEAGDAITFDADRAHRYRNLGDGEVVAYLVMTYAEQVS